MGVEFEQNYYPQTATDIYKIGNDSIRLVKRMAYSDKCYENINCFDLRASVLSVLNIERS